MLLGMLKAQSWRYGEWCSPPQPVTGCTEYHKLQLCLGYCRALAEMIFTEFDGQKIDLVRYLCILMDS